MNQNLTSKVLKVEGMTCVSCEMRIQNSLKKIEGVTEVKANFSKSLVDITYDLNTTSLNDIIEVIEKLEYKVVDDRIKQVEETKNKPLINPLIGFAIILLAGYTIINHTIGFNFIPTVTKNMGYGVLFIVGLLTSLHCIAMCGGINLSQCMSYKFDENDTSRFSKFKPSFMYNLGRVVSYTIIGGIVGSIGSVVSFSGMAQGLVAIIAGAFMVIMGLNMLNIFPWLRKFNPRMPKVFGKLIHENKSKHGPFYVGLLNGFMPCGPLQAMQLYALGTGSFVAGAASMFFFSIGTVPLMFGFGAISSFFSQKFTKDMMKVSGALVIALGIVMAGRGLSLSGINVMSFATGLSDKSVSIAKTEEGIQYITTTLESGKYTPIVVQKGVPVRWTIEAAKGDLNGCNNEIIIKEYNIQKKLVVGENIIEFTPEEEGKFTYTCWMGMIRSNIKVVADVNDVPKDQQEDTLLDTGLPTSSGGCCADGSKAVKFANGNIPTDDILVAKIVDNKQEVTITVNEFGYSPAAIVVQKGIETKIKFNTEQLNSCNNIVVFPEYNGQLDLEEVTETPWLLPEQDFTFACWMGMLNGYVKVVDDINDIDMTEIKEGISSYQPIGGGGCCGQ
ncbi:MAG: heavy metal transporter [Firmicutes bacterium HGW-Firmicutes-1]|jgi:sulfite exporter TauE/SafE/copper chaperone CopZ|nr:MAG: heavy metal transporter [Firmicutes bacterium HGW-Firmicutes-1]